MGGDVINPYFLKDIVPQAHRVHAISVGMPYKEFVHLFEVFHTVATRNPDDVPLITPRCFRAVYFPDMGFLLPRWWGSNGGRATGRIGISIPRNYYQKDSMDYVRILEFFAKIIRAIQQKFPSKEVWLIPFCIQPDKHYENDTVLNDQLAELCTGVCLFTPSRGGYIREIYDKIGEMEFMICGRFHAHVFTICHGKPFVSLSSSRKCRKLMESLGLMDQCITLGTNTDERPVVPRDPQSTIQKIIDSIHSLDAQRILDIYQNRIQPDCDRFIDFYRDLVSSKTDNHISHNSN